MKTRKKLNYVVLCWLMEPGDRENIEKIITMTQSFQSNPGVLEAQAGKVVMSDRRIVDDSFDVGILIQVQDEDALQLYLDHPRHQKAKDEILLPLIEKVLVYDFME
ncbi:MAG: Dabb family protein [Verrucomicrobiota bacterium]|nr:Dabb family protein [Verrucomicrobiota bacterium]